MWKVSVQDEMLSILLLNGSAAFFTCVVASIDKARPSKALIVVLVMGKVLYQGSLTALMFIT